MADFFISYNHVDSNWAQWVAWQLENAGYNVIIDVWDFRPADDFVYKMNKACEEAERLITILSDAYFREGSFTQNEWTAFLVKSKKEKKELIVPIRIEAFKEPPIFSNIIWINMVGVTDEKKAQELLLNGVIKTRAKAKQKPTFPGKPEKEEPPFFPGNLPFLTDEEQFLRMVKAAYIFLRTDQFSSRLDTGDAQDNHLWGWSIWDPARKKQVAESQKREKRAASLVVSSFVLSAYGSVLNWPGDGIQSDTIKTGLVNSLKQRYSPHGVFGTVREIEFNIEGELKKIVVPNCRHITAAITQLLRISKASGDTPVSLNEIHGALRYLIELEGDAIFSQRPDEGTQAPLDSQTCAIVLEFLDYLGLAPDIILDNTTWSHEKNPFDSPGSLENWRQQKIQRGIDLLDGLKVEVPGTNAWLWDYRTDKKRYVGWTGSGIPPYEPIGEPISLYHIARILYLTRNLIHQMDDSTLKPRLNDLKRIAKRLECTLPECVPYDDDNKRPHITNTAFFLNALIPDDLRYIDSGSLNILRTGVAKLASLFDEGLQLHLDDLMDLRTDGFCMILRLARCLRNYSSIRDTLQQKVKAWDNCSFRIQELISKHDMQGVSKELEKAEIPWFSEIINRRIAEPKKLWHTWGK